MEFALDIIIILLVATMIAYSVILNIRLKNFRNNKNELAEIIGKLNETISQAQASLDNLKKMAVFEEGRLEGLIKKSRLMADELSIITESGERIASRIEQGLIPAAKLDSEDDLLEELQDEETEYEEENEMLEALKKIR